MSNVDIVIYTRDRACQLFFLLQSIKRFVPDIERTWVLHRSTSPEFLEGYSRLQELTYHDNIIFISRDKQKNQEIALKGALAEALGKSDSTYIIPMCDDHVYINPMSALRLSEAFAEINKEVNGELRQILTELTPEDSWQYHVESPNKLKSKPHIPEMIYESDQFVAWNIKDYRQDYGSRAYGYSGVVTASIMEREAYLEQAMKFRFNSVHDLERRFKRNPGILPPVVASFRKGVRSVNTCANSASKPNRKGFGHGSEHFYSIYDLNDKFLNGYCIDLDAMIPKLRKAHTTTGTCYLNIPFSFTSYKHLMEIKIEHE